MPKAFHEIARWDGGLNTHFDESDIEGTELSDVSLWSVSKPGQIYTISNYVATGTPPQSGSFDGTTFTSADRAILVRYGFIIAESDYNIGTNEAAAVVETRYAFIIDSAGELTVLQAFAANSGTNSTAGIMLDSASGLGTSSPKPRMFWSEGALRISDSIHGGGSQVKWWGVVSFQRFTNDDDDPWNNPMGAIGGDNPKWVWVNASQPKPAVIGTSTSSTTTNYGMVWYGSTAFHYPSDNNARGKGINMNISASTSATDGGWEATSYEFGQTLVYVGNQESMIAPMRIYNSGDTADVSIASQQYWTSIKVFTSVNATYNYDPRVTGARIYIRKIGQNKRWTLFLDADFERGVRRNTFDSFDFIWERNQASGFYASNSTFSIKSPSPQTYESLNGYSPNESLCSFENATHGWEHSTILNRRTFLIGVKYLNDYSGQSEVMPDRIYYSAMAKYDTYPTTNWIDIGVNDGESFTAIEGFANRILAFKQGTLYIINVQNPNDGGWFLEAELKGMGITSADAVTKSDQGILFANTTGLFRFAGDGIPKRLTDKLNKTDWTTDLSTASHFIQVGYDGASEQCFVGEVGIVAGGLHTASSPVYIYDFRTGSFVRHTNYLTDGRSNFSNIPDTRELLWIEPDSDNATDQFKISKYAANTLGAEESIVGDQYFITKLDDLGSPALMKKFYNLYINLKTGGAYNFDVIVNGTTVNTSGGTIGSFTKLKVSLSTVANASTFQLKILNKATTSITINSISLEYRVLYKRVS